MDGSDPACRGAQSFRVQTGWHTYDFAIKKDADSGPIDWAGEIRGLVLTPTASGGQVEIDWIRLYQPTNAPIAVTSRDSTPGARLIWDQNRRTDDNKLWNRKWGVISETSTGELNTDAMPPGTYYIYSEVGRVRSYVNKLIINQRPQVRVVSPNVLEGADYATTIRQDPWDFSQTGDVALVRNMSYVLRNGRLVGTNTGATPSDSGFRLEIHGIYRLTGLGSPTLRLGFTTTAISAWPAGTAAV